jgi:hypothetical protein
MIPVVVRTLPDGRVCIHWLMRDPEGPIQTMNQVVRGAGAMMWKGARFRCACQPERTSLNTSEVGRTVQFTHTDDPRAATCPKCLATVEYKDAMARLQGLQTHGV